MAKKLEVIIEGVVEGFHQALGTAGRDADSFGSKLGGLGKIAGIAAGGAGLAAVFKTLDIGVDEWKEHNAVATQTQAVLKATGDAANVTASDVENLAGSLMKKTGIDDEAIQATENLILRFKNVRNEAGAGNDIFNRTTKAVEDMAVATGKSADALGLKLAKALNDPVAGLSRLSSLGISFTEGQKEQIKALEESGHTLEAQKIILDKVNESYGGAAEAAGKTLPGQINILKQEFNNFAGDLVGKLVPVLTDLLTWFQTHWPEISATIERGWQTVKPLFDGFVTVIATVASEVQKHWGLIKQEFGLAFDFVKTTVQGIVAALRLPIDLIHGDWSKAWSDVVTIVKAPIQRALDVIDAFLAPFHTSAGKLASGVKNAITGVLGDIGGWFRNLWNGIEDGIAGAVKGVTGAASRFGSGIVSGIGSGLESLGEKLVSWLVAPINAVIDRIDSLHIPGFSVNTHIPGVGKISFPGLDPFHIPHLAEGGIVTSPTLALIGEAGPEAVMPLSKAGMGKVVHVHFDGANFYGAPDRSTARQWAKALQPHLEQVIAF